MPLLLSLPHANKSQISKKPQKLGMFSLRVYLRASGGTEGLLVFFCPKKLVLPAREFSVFLGRNREFLASFSLAASKELQFGKADCKRGAGHSLPLLPFFKGFWRFYFIYFPGSKIHFTLTLKFPEIFGIILILRINICFFFFLHSHGRRVFWQIPGSLKTGKSGFGSAQPGFLQHSQLPDRDITPSSAGTFIHKTPLREKKKNRTNPKTIKKIPTQPLPSPNGAVGGRDNLGIALDPAFPAGFSMLGGEARMGKGYRPCRGKHGADSLRFTNHTRSEFFPVLFPFFSPFFPAFLAGIWELHGREERKIPFCPLSGSRR